MDGHPNPKPKTWNGQQVSETRYSVVTWLEKELPKLNGSVIDIGAGNWRVPKNLLNSKKAKYTSYDKKFYGDNKNNIDIVGDIESMPKKWTNKWDNVLCIEVLECIKNPLLGVEEIRRILKPGGTAIITAPFNYRWFGQNSWPGRKPSKNPVKDYWRITKDGWEMLTEKFNTVNIKNSGPNVWDPYCYMIKAIK